MELTVSKADLNKALSLTQNIVAKKTTMPILVNVLLSATQNELRVSATDLDMTAVVCANASVRSKGSTTVNAKVFADIVKELPDGEVLLKLTEGERLEVSVKGSRFRVIGISAEEFPGLPGVSVEPKGNISAKQLVEMINKTIYSVSQDETRINLNGVCFEMVKKAAAGKGNKSERGLKMVATDGHRLALITRPASDLDAEGSFIVPRRALAEIRKFFDSEDDRQVKIGFHEGFMLLESEGTKLSVRLVDAEFPNYEQVIPKEVGVVASVNSQELAQALRRVALMVSDKGKCVKMDFSSDSLKISSSSPELGDASEELKIKYAGVPLSVGFNAIYMIDIINSISEAQQLLLELNGELGAAKLSCEGDDSYMAIVMPMRLNS